MKGRTFQLCHRRHCLLRPIPIYR